MDGNGLTVWRDVAGVVEPVGFIAVSDTGLSFSYDDSYRGPAISASMPVGSGPVDETVSTRFFDALLPEGQSRRAVMERLHAGGPDEEALLKALRNESVGALLLSYGGLEPYRNPSYDPVEDGFFDDLAARPLGTSSRTLVDTRLSLAGAMAKVGLFRERSSGRWFRPLGGAPSSHIVKVGDRESFPDQVENEAVCMLAARLCGLPAAETELVGTGDAPVLAVGRFDRPTGRGRTVSGMEAPLRLHQEDFIQALALPSWQKYEPTGRPNLELMASVLEEHGADPIEDTRRLFAYTVFNYLVGNCDNHLKNHSVLYDGEWSSPRLAPLYDVCSTTVYPDLSREMGTSFGGSRVIDDVDRGSVLSMARRLWIPGKVAEKILDDLAAEVPGAVEQASTEIADAGFPEARTIGEEIFEGASERARRVSS